MAALGSLVIELAANTARLQSDMGKAVGIAQRTANQLSGAFKGIAGGLIGATLIGTARQAIALGDDLNKAAIKAGLSGRAISELAYAAKQSDIDIAGLSNSLRFMQTNLSKAASGGKEAQATLAALGLSVEELRRLAPDKQFEVLADRISRLKDPADRARAAVELFGKSGADLLPLFEQGADGIRKAREEARRLGATLNDEQIKKLADADDAIKRLSQSWDVFFAKLASKAATILTPILDALSGVNRASAQDAARKNFVLLSAELKALERQRASIKGDQIDTSSLDAKIKATRRKLNNLLQPINASDLVSRRVDVPGFSAVAESAKQKAESVTRAFELDPATLDRIAFEDWKRQTIDNMDEVIRAGADMSDELTAYANETQAAWQGSSNELSVYADQAARNMQSAMADFFFDPFADGLKGMLKGFVDILRRMVAEAAAAKIFEALGFGAGGFGGGGGGLGGLFSGITKLFGFANGGQFKVGGSGGTDSQLVAFRASPNETVTVTRPDQRAGGGVVYAPTFNVNAPGADPGSIKKIQAMLAEHGRQIFDELDRRYGLRT